MSVGGDYNLAQVGILLLSLAGLANAVVMTLAYYGRVIPSRLLPAALCKRGEGTCLTVLHTPYARTFGVPNSLLGILFYLVMLGGVGYVGTHPAVLYSLSAAAGAAFLFGIYLIYALRFRLRASCPLCYLGHAVNTALMVLVGTSALRN